MNWLFKLHGADPVAHAVGILALVCAAGMALGSIKVRGIGLGSAGVLFAGILAGHFGRPVDRDTLVFVKEFGLLLFVFTIGLQQGPGFFATLRQQGLRMNALAAATVILGAAGTVLIGRLAGFDPAAVLGIFSGASFNMPSLGAATQALNTVADLESDRAALPALACAVTFPMAIVSSIAVLLLIRRIFRIDPARETADAAAERQRAGPRKPEEFVPGDGRVTSRRVVVTSRPVLGRTVRELNLEAGLGVVVSSIDRGGLEMAAVPALRLQFGDALQIVGSPESLDKAAATLGNSLRELNETHFIPLFIGIFLGVAAGTLPIAIPGLPQPVRLGLAGGPLIVALIIGRFGRIGRLVCHMPRNANLAFREFGMALFFAAVGLDAGAKFFQTVFSLRGVEWLLAGVCVTAGPLLLTGIFARTVCRFSFSDLSGLLAGSTTNPPALAFATNLAGSDAPTVAYAAVYPLTMLLRVLCAQVLALTLMG